MNVRTQAKLKDDPITPERRGKKRVRAKRPRCEREKIYNKKKEEQLGMGFGPANYLLRKQLLFAMAIKLVGCACFRCGQDIESVDDFSVDHKEAWAQSEDPRKSFFDLENIAFSHTTCNIRAASKPTKIYASAKECKRIGQRRRMAATRADPDLRRAFNASKRAAYARRMAKAKASQEQQNASV